MNSNIKNCILCDSNKIKHVQNIDKNDLNKLYLSAFGFEILDEFKKVSSIEFVKCLNCNLNFFDSNTAGTALFYEKLQQNRKVYYSPDRKEFFYAKQFINANDNVLEIGSGNGFFADKIKDTNYVGLEFNDKAIADAEIKNITLIKKSIETYAVDKTECFDVVCSFHVLEHVQNPKEFLLSAIKTLKKGGKLIISVPCNDSALTDNKNHVLNLPPHHISKWKINSLKEIATIFNLKIIEYKIHSINVINKKSYLSQLLTNKLIDVIYPKNNVYLQDDKLRKVSRYSNAIVNRTPLYKLFSKKYVIGENITMIFQK